jgi:preprotein translocase subunit SecD
VAAPSNEPRPVLSFIWLTVITVALVVLVGAGAIWSSATWAPKLALDLEGGTSIILEPQVDEETTISSEQLEQAVAIIRQRVDGTGVSEAEITTQGDRNIIVNLPGNPDEETRELVRSSAQLAFRRVAYQGAPQPVSEDGAPTDEATEDPTARTRRTRRAAARSRRTSRSRPGRGRSSPVRPLSPVRRISPVRERRTSLRRPSRASTR